MSAKHLQILLVDDDDCSLLGVAVNMTEHNICLRNVTDGEQAIDYLEGRGVYADRSTHPVPDLVVLDLNMRVTGGLEFLDWRRASASFASLPVVIFGDADYRSAIEKAWAKGADAFIAKPLEFEGWDAAVRQIWDLGMERSAAIA